MVAGYRASPPREHPHHARHHLRLRPLCLYQGKIAAISSASLLTTFPLDSRGATIPPPPCFDPQIFSSNSCIGYNSDDRQPPGESEFFLRSDLSVKCYESTEHNELIALMWFFACIWPIGTVVLYSLLLVPCKTPILLGERTPLVEATFFLTHDYKPYIFYWEPLELIR